MGVLTKHPWLKNLVSSKNPTRKNKIHHQAQQIPPLKSHGIRRHRNLPLQNPWATSRGFQSLAALNKEAANFFRLAAGSAALAFTKIFASLKRWTSKNKSFEKKIHQKFLDEVSYNVSKFHLGCKTSLALALAAWESAWQKLFLRSEDVWVEPRSRENPFQIWKLGMIFSCIPEWYIFTWTTVETYLGNLHVLWCFSGPETHPTKKINRVKQGGSPVHPFKPLSFPVVFQSFPSLLESFPSRLCLANVPGLREKRASTLGDEKKRAPVGGPGWYTLTNYVIFKNIHKNRRAYCK